MRQISNITATTRALAALQRQFAEARPRRGDVTALVYVSSYTEKDGRTVEGFEPGYMVGPVTANGFGEMWLEARLPQLPPLLFMPKFKWRPDGNYLVDLAGTKFVLFTIEPRQLT